MNVTLTHDELSSFMKLALNHAQVDSNRSPQVEILRSDRIMLRLALRDLDTNLRCTAEKVGQCFRLETLVDILAGEHPDLDFRGTREFLSQL